MLNIHYKNTSNLGDVVSAPSLYFPLGAERRHLASTPRPCKALIIGGGGLLHPALSRMVQRHLPLVTGPIIVWGVGTNTHGTSNASAPAWLKRCDLVGLRDSQSAFPWLPCASCLSAEFDRQAPPEFEAVVYRHHWSVHDIPHREGLPTMTNKSSKLADVVNFLLKGEVVITNTYHGMYWATLLGRKVVVYPFSSRHHHARHAPTLITDGSHWREVLPHARSYPQALSECREASHAFYAKVKPLLPESAGHPAARHSTQRRP